MTCGLPFYNVRDPGVPWQYESESWWFGDILVALLSAFWPILMGHLRWDNQGVAWFVFGSSLQKLKRQIWILASQLT